MMYAFLMMAMTLLGGIVRLAQALRLSVPLLYGALVITVFRPWYLTHTALADGIFFVLVGLVALSWVVSLIRVVERSGIEIGEEGLTILSTLPHFMPLPFS